MFLDKEQDFKKGYAWFSIASAGGDVESINYRDEITKNLSTQLLNEAQQLSSKLCMRNFRFRDNPFRANLTYLARWPNLTTVVITICQLVQNAASLNRSGT